MHVQMDLLESCFERRRTTLLAHLIPRVGIEAWQPLKNRLLDQQTRVKMRQDIQVRRRQRAGLMSIKTCCDEFVLLMDIDILLGLEDTPIHRIRLHRLATELQVRYKCTVDSAV